MKFWRVGLRQHVAPPSPPGDTPHPAEVFTVVRVSETKLAFKSAYGRYVGVTTSGELAGRAEAVGPREQWELVFEEVCGLGVNALELSCALAGQCSFVCLQPSLPGCDRRR